jgi:hypothetical protein
MSATSETTSLNIITYGNADVIRSNSVEMDVFEPRYNSTIGLSGTIIPTADDTYSIGSESSKLGTVVTTNCDVTTVANINQLVIDTMVFRNQTSGNINYTGNLVPTIDDAFFVGFPDKRWKRMVVGDLAVDNIIASGIITGNLDVTTNSNLIDVSTIISDDIDNSKQFRFQAEEITSNTLREFIVPDGDTKLVGNDFPETLTNKTITGTTNLVEAQWLATNLSNVGNVVVISGANPPITGQVLTATTSTTAAWLNPSEVVGGSAVTDNQFISATSLQSTTSGTFVNIPGMTLTASVPIDMASYLCVFGCTCYGGNNSTSLDFAFAVNGTTVSGTVIRVTPETKERNATIFYTVDNVVDGDIITAQWRRSGGSQDGNITFRSMSILGFGTQ